MNCSNCDYAVRYNGGLFCVARKRLPPVRSWESCDRWSPNEQTMFGEESQQNGNS